MTTTTSETDEHPGQKLDPPDTIDASSPSVQAHITIMQSVIQRMASNSSAAKTWCITLVSAILVVIADKSKPEFAWIAILPTFLFMCLDTYYLAFEKGFRASYNGFIAKLHDGTLTTSDLYSVTLEGEQSKHQRDALKSFSIWGFYLVLFVLIVLARYVVLG